MNACILALALTMGCGTAPAPPQAPATDSWLAEDKLQHFALSFAATQTSYGAIRLAADHDAAVIAAAATALALGVAKELHDVRLGRPFSLEDLAWNAAGVTLGVLLIRQID